MKAIILAMALLMSNVVLAELQAGPFGIKWGSSVKEIKAQGIKLEEMRRVGERLSAFNTDKLPKNFSLAETYTLIFDKSYNLQKILVTSKDIDDDVYGAEGKEKYSATKDKLKNKYGEPTVESERFGMALYDEPDEFYQCLQYAGCGQWGAIFEPKSEEVTVSIELKGLGRGKGFIRLTYEGPLWLDVIDAIKSSESKSDDDAL